MYFVYQISYMALSSLVHNYAYLCKVMYSPTYSILHSLEFHSAFSRSPCYSLIFFSRSQQAVLSWINTFQINLIILNNSNHKDCKLASLVVCWVPLCSSHRYYLNHHLLHFWYRLFLQIYMHMRTVKSGFEQSNHLQFTCIQPGLNTSHFLSKAEKPYEYTFSLLRQSKCR